MSIANRLPRMDGHICPAVERQKATASAVAFVAGALAMALIVVILFEVAA